MRQRFDVFVAARAKGNRYPADPHGVDGIRVSTHYYNTFEQVDRVFQNPLWKNVEMCMLSGGEPTTRNDMVEVSQVFLDRLPKLRKYGINNIRLFVENDVRFLRQF